MVSAEDKDLKKIFDAAVQTYRQNTFTIYMDCPSRERAGWLCDSLGGYHYFFMWALLATVPAFLLAARIPFTYPDTEEVTAEEVDKELINE